MLIAPVAKSLKLIEAARSSSVLGRLPTKIRPAAQLFYDLYHAKYLPHAPRGLRSGAEAVDTFRHAQHAYDIIRKLPDLARAVSRGQFSRLALDLAHIAGLDRCVQAVRDGLAG